MCFGWFVAGLLVGAGAMLLSAYLTIRWEKSWEAVTEQENGVNGEER